MLYTETLCCKQREEGVKVMGLLLQSFINGNPQDISMRLFAFESMPLVVGGAATLGIFDN